jgi:dihydrofolate reductase
MSLDGCIAGPKGEFDWIVPDPGVDFGALFAQFDTFLMGRHTWELTTRPDSPPPPPGTRTFVFSRTLESVNRPGTELLREVTPEAIDRIKAGAKKDIWLFGGGRLFQSLLTQGLVDTVEVGVNPVLLGGGLPLLPSPAPRTGLRLTGHRALGSGTVMLEYAVQPQAA